MSKQIAVIVGSLRKESINKKMAKQLIQLAPSSLELSLVDISDLPLYNEDIDTEGNVPAAYTRFRKEMKSYDAVLFVTPEYNRSVPGCLKNALDVGSRPYGHSIWQKKPAAIISVSPGAVGGFGANHHLRQSLVFLDMPTLQQPEAYIGKGFELFKPDGEFASEDTRKFMHSFMEIYAHWVATNT